MDMRRFRRSTAEPVEEQNAEPEPHDTQPDVQPELHDTQPDVEPELHDTQPDVQPETQRADDSRPEVQPEPDDEDLSVGVTPSADWGVDEDPDSYSAPV